MAFVNQTRPGALGSKVIIDEAAGASPQQDVFSGSCVLNAVMIDCTEQTTADVFLKMDDDIVIVSGATQTKPAYQFYCPAGTTMQYTIPEGIVCNAGLSYYLSTTSGSELIASAESPTGAVKVYLVGT